MEKNMGKSTSDLIQGLVQNYKPRPWWKKTFALFLIWFSFHITYFLIIGFFQSESIFLRSSAFYVVSEMIGSLITGFMFIYLFLHPELKENSIKKMLIFALCWMAISLFIESYFMKTTSNARGLSLNSGDMSCFLHSTIVTAGTLLVFPFIFRHFFFARPKSAIAIMSIHLAILGSGLNELKCPDREVWHLILGHQTSVIGVGLFLMLVIFFFRISVSLKNLDHGKL